MNMVIFWAFWFGIQRGCVKMETFLSIREIGWRHASFLGVFSELKKFNDLLFCWQRRIPLWESSSPVMLSCTNSDLPLRLISNCLVFIYQFWLCNCSNNTPAETTWQLITFKIILRYVFPTDLISHRQLKDLFSTSETLRQYMWYVSLHVAVKWEKLQFLLILLVNFT